MVPSLLIVSAALVLNALPVFLVGGLAVQIRAEMGFSEAALGAAVTAAFAAAALFAPVGGRLADRMGARMAIATGSLLSILALAGIGGLAGTWWQLTGLLLLAGLGFTFTDPGLAILVVGTVPYQRQGLTFGVKEASIPTATLVAGLAVPLLAVTVGWRWAFLAGLAPLVVVAFLLPRMDMPPRRQRADREVAPSGGASPKALFLVAAAVALGSGAGSGIGVFLTESAVSMGFSAPSAGLLLAAGSVAGIVARVVTGVLADRTGREQLGVIFWMMSGGAAAMAMGATGVGFLVVAGTLGAFAGGWGWTGLLFLFLVRANPLTPGTAAGIGLTGLGLGNAAGPLLFGVVAQGISFQAAWALASIIAASAAVLIRVARHRVAVIPRKPCPPGAQRQGEGTCEPKARR